MRTKYHLENKFRRLKKKQRMSSTEAGAEVTASHNIKDAPPTATENTEDANIAECAKVDNEIVLQNELNDAQLKQIEEEQKVHPLIGDKIPIESLIIEYDPETSKEYHNKAKELAETYCDIRQMRRDGNCFYRALLVAEIELMYKSKEELYRFETVCKGWQKRLMDLGFPDFTTADFCEYFYEWLTPIKNAEKTMTEVFDELSDDGHANYLILFLRLITSGYLKENSDEYTPFIDDTYKNLSEYCQIEIEVMWKDADHIAVTGLVNAIGRAIRVEYMDQSAAPNGGWHYDFPPDKEDDPQITLLYRPGHYDLIYKK
ncbi:unnamed protein product [Auanema sp. JU1783]|nr:unnamed protein product [Auanema sp. JU1783]